MYLPYYGLNQPPFSISPDPNFLWFSSTHQQAFSALKYGILEEKGFLTLIGEVGTGKTLLIKNLINDVGIPAIIVTIPDPDMKTLDFFTFLAEEAEMNTPFRAKGEFLIQFKKFLLEAYGSDKRVLLIIDEAQRLSFELLEQIRLLSNIEMTNKKLLNIFFVGQNEFDQILMDERSKATRQRIAVRYRLEPFDKEETGSYIDHRLKVAGANKEIFSSDAIQEIYNLSKGFPRNINVICDNALMVGFGLELENIGGDVISEYTKDLVLLGDIEPNEMQEQVSIEPNLKLSNQVSAAIPRKEEISRRPASYFRNMIIFVFLLLFGFAGYFIYDTNTDRHSPWSVQEIAPKKDFGFPETEKGAYNSKEEFQPKKILENQNADVLSQTAAVKEKENTKVVQPELIKQTEINRGKPLAQDLSKSTDVEDFNNIKKSKIESLIYKKPQKDQAKKQSMLVTSTLSEDIERISKNKKWPQSASPSVIDGRIIIYFNHDSLKLSEQSLETLKLVLNIISKYPDSSIIIRGYTDRHGNFWYNKKLSQSRANAIKSYLENQGITPSRIQAQGMGSQNPIGNNTTKQGRRQNRRAEIEITKEDERNIISFKNN
jgi:general secretion pathway protein A